MRFGILGQRRKRKDFKISTKKREWARAAGRDPFGPFIKTSKCRECPRKLTWGDGTYNFDHKDNNTANNSQRNCYLVCRNCHGKHTKIGKRKIKSFGMVVGYKTIKKKVGYKKQRKGKKTKKRKIKYKSLFDNLRLPKIRY